MDESQWVKPVVDSATPYHQSVIFVDPRNDPSKCSLFVDGIHIRHAKRNHANQQLEMRVIGINTRVHPTQRGQLAQIKVSLTLRGAEKIIPQ